MYSMKHLLRINEMTKHELKKFVISKETLDNLTYDELRDLRVDLISNSRVDYKRKTDELIFYMEIRFKEREFEMYNEWYRKSLITKKVKKEDGFYQDFYHDVVLGKYFTETEMESFKLLSQVIDNMGGNEKYYKMIMDNRRKVLGDSKYSLY